MIRLGSTGAQFRLRQTHLGDCLGHLGDLGRAHLREVLLLQHLAIGYRKMDFLLLRCLALAADRRLRQRLLNAP